MSLCSQRIKGCFGAPHEVSNCHEYYDLILDDSLKMAIVRSHQFYTEVGPFCNNTEIIHL